MVPTITSLFLPTGNVPGGALQINGTNLENATSVAFSGTNTSARFINDPENGTLLVVQIPRDTPLGPTTVTVTTPGGSVSVPYEIVATRF